MTALLAVLVAVASAAQAGGATDARSGALTEILTPRDGSLVTPAGSGAVTVRVRTSRNVRVFNAFIGLTPVTGSFSRPRHGTRTARFRVGRVLRLGQNTLTIRSSGATRSEFDRVTFTVVRRRAGLLSVQTRQRVFPRQLVNVALRVSTTDYSLHASLNGQAVTGRFATDAKRSAAALDVDDGLRYGRNVLVVTAIRGGSYDRVTRTFTVRRIRALVGAGQPATIRATLPVRLDATRSRPAGSGDVLRYSWRIVRRPAGSKRPMLLRARTARPTLVPDVNGRFTLQVKVRELGPMTNSASVSALLTSPSTDTVTVAAQCNAPPIGATVTTIPVNGSGITVRCANSTATVPGSGNGIQMLVLWRNTLEEDRANSGSFSLDGAGLTAFNAAVSRIAKPTGTSPGELMILTGAGNVSGPLSSGWVQALENAYQQFGGTLAPFGPGGAAQAFATGEWSLIGVEGMIQGQAAQDYGAQPPGYDAGQAGSLNGYLQQDTQSNYTFNFGQYVPFDTAVPGSTTTTQNTISIGSPSSFVNETFTSQALPQGTSGFHVLVLGQGDLRKIDELTIATNNANGAIEQNVSQLASYLQRVATGQGFIGYPRLVIVQSIGEPQARSNNWPQQLAPAIANLGGTKDIVNGQNGTAGGYTLIGGSNLSGFGTEQSSSITGLPARLTGVLRPNRQDQFVGDISDPTGKAGYDIYTIAYQPATNWPVPSTPGQEQAMACIARNWPGGLKDQTDVRADYYLEQMDWSGWTTTNLETAADKCAPGTSYNPASCVPGTVSTGDVTAVFCALANEMPIVSELGSYFSGLQSALIASQAVSEAKLEQLGHNIAVDVQPPPQSNASLKRGYDIAAEVLRVAAIFVPVPVAPAALGAAAGGLQLTTDFLDDANGNNTATAAVETATSNLNVAAGEQMLSAYQNMDKVYDLLVSDYGKLSAAGELQGQWAAQSNQSDYIKSLQLSAQQWFYAALMPVAYRVYDVDRNPPQGCVAGNPPIIPVFQNAPNYSWVATASGSKVLWSSALQGANAMPPPESLVSPMFNQNDPNWVGLYPQWFFNQNFDPIPVDCQ